MSFTPDSAGTYPLIVSIAFSMSMQIDGSGLRIILFLRFWTIFFMSSVPSAKNSLFFVYMTISYPSYIIEEMLAAGGSALFILSNNTAVVSSTTCFTFQKFLVIFLYLCGSKIFEDVLCNHF